MPSDLPCEYTGVSMLAAGQSATRTVFPLAALPFASVPTSTTEFLVAEKPHWGLGGKVPIWEPRFPYANHQSPLGLPVCSYDSGRRSRCTGKERDAETGLDFFGARYFSGAQGRFTSPDKPFADQHPKDPQSWNLYSYVRNNPLRYTDSTGEACDNGVLQCAADAVKGAAKEVANGTAVPAANLVNFVLDTTILGPLGIPIGQVPQFQAENSDQQEAMTLTAFAVVATGTPELTSPLTTSEKLSTIHTALDDIAQERRTTAVLETDNGTLAAGGTKDLTPNQRIAAREVGATPVKLPGQHAEITVLDHAGRTGATPRALEASRPFCPDCRAFIQATGGVIVSAVRAIWP